MSIEDGKNYADKPQTLPAYTVDNSFTRQNIIQDLIKTKPHETADQLIQYADKLVQYISKGKN